MDRLAVRLRPFTEPDLVLFDRFGDDPAMSEPFEWFGFTSSEPMHRRWKEDRLLEGNPCWLVVAAVEDDAPVGCVDWRRNDRNPGVVEIGVLIVPAMRGRSAGTAAQRLLIDYLFSTTTAHRIWAGTEVENLAEQRALEHCGLRREGLLRGHHFRDGGWRDGFIYGITRDDWGSGAPDDD